MNRIKFYIGILKTIMERESRRIVSRPLYLWGMVGVPLFCFIFFPSFMKDGLPTNIPIGIVDNDNTFLSRSIARNLDAFAQTKIVCNYESVTRAREALQRGEIYGFYYFPNNLSKNVQGQRQPKISFYTNNSYLVPGSLLFKDMKHMSELGSAAVNRKIMYAKGATDQKIFASLQPIVVDAHPLGNPILNYSVYLSNVLIPGMLCLMIFMMTVYAIGVEIKDGTAREWLEKGNHSMTLSLLGKLLPHTIIFFIIGVIYNLLLYGYLGYPVNGGIYSMILATLFFVLSSQACGIFMITLLPSLRLGLSAASLWGILSFALSGFSFPVIGMYAPAHTVSYLFPLRHYYLIYVNQALNGYPLVYAWKYYIFLLLFIFVPCATLGRLKKELIYYKYMP